MPKPIMQGKVIVTITNPDGEVLEEVTFMDEGMTANDEWDVEASADLASDIIDDLMSSYNHD